MLKSNVLAPLVGVPLASAAVGGVVSTLYFHAAPAAVPEPFLATTDQLCSPSAGFTEIWLVGTFVTTPSMVTSYEVALIASSQSKIEGFTLISALFDGVGFAGVPGRFRVLKVHGPLVVEPIMLLATIFQV